MRVTVIPDPLNLAWPRAYGSCLLRPVTEHDVDDILAYRSRPEVVRFLTHPVLNRDAVLARIHQRIRPLTVDAREVTRGLAVEVKGRLVGDAMMRVDHTDEETGPRVWIGYAFDPEAWGKGYATDTATCLTRAGTAMGLRVWADTVPGNVGSERVLTKAGLHLVGVQVVGNGPRNVFASD